MKSKNIKKRIIGAAMAATLTLAMFGGTANAAQISQQEGLTGQTGSGKSFISYSLGDKDVIKKRSLCATLPWASCL